LERFTPVRGVPEHLRGFVDLQARIEGRELEGDEQVALLVVEGTSSYVAVFLDAKGVFDLEARLSEQNAGIAPADLARILEAASKA